MLNQRVQHVEREKAGLIDPTDAQRRRPLKEHVQDFERYLNHKGITPKQVGETLSKLKKIIADRKWRLIADITAGSVIEYWDGCATKGSVPKPTTTI